MSRPKKLPILDNIERLKTENNKLLETNSARSSESNKEYNQARKMIKRSSNRKITKKQRQTISSLIPSSNILNKFLSNQKNENDIFIDDVKEQEKKSLRQIFDKFFTTKRMNVVKIVDGVVSLLSFLFYIVCTYKPSLFVILDYLDILITLIYLLYFSIELILAHHRLSYLLSLSALILLYVV